MAEMQDTKFQGIHYRLEGKSGAPVLVFSNSLGTDLSLWDPQAEFFKKDFQILRYDTRGHGGSDLISAHFSVEELSQDLLGLMENLEISEAHFCGVSLGAFTGIWLGYRHPGRFQTLILANTAPRIGTRENWQSRIDLVKKEGLAPVAASSASRWFTTGFVSKQADQVQKIASNLLKTNPEAYIGCCEILKETNLRGSLPLIQLPTLIIAGNADSVSTVAEAQEMKAQIKNSQLAILSASHLSNIEAVNFNQVMAEFLKTRAS